MVVHTLILDSGGRQVSESEAGLVYRVSSKTVRAIQRNCLKKKIKCVCVCARALLRTDRCTQIMLDLDAK